MAGPGGRLTRLEVRKGAKSTVWYDAVLHDLFGQNALVGFPDDVWPNREVPCGDARPRPADGDQDDDFEAGDEVEVRVAASERNPPGWALGTVLQADERVVRVACHSRRPTDSLVFQVGDPALRHASDEAPLHPGALARGWAPVSEELRGWAASSDARGCWEQVCAVAGLSLVAPGSAAGRRDAGHADAVVLLGTPGAVRRGEMLVKIHLMHQQEVEAFQRRRSKKLGQLQEALDKASGTGGTARASFKVEADLVGRTCGKGGERIARVQKEHDVEIRIVDNDDKDGPRTVVILGNSEEVVARARSELELTWKDYFIDPERVDWFLGKENGQVREISRKASLAATNWTGEVLQLCGDERSLEDAIMLLDSHNEYFLVFQEMTRQTQEIERSFEQLDVAAQEAGLAPLGRPRPVVGVKGRGKAAGAEDAGETERVRGRGARGRAGRKGGGRPDGGDGVAGGAE